MRTLLLTLTTCLLVLPANAKYSGGTGEPNDPYQIATAADLILLGETPGDYGKHFILTADIDLDPNLPGRKVFDKAVIGATWGPPFTGVFNGNGHTISHLKIEGTNYLGLFGYLINDYPVTAEVKNLGVVDADVHGSGDYVGALIGENGEGYHGEHGGIVTRCYSTGVVTGAGSVGGLIGMNDGYVTQCYSTCVVTRSGSAWGGVGGLVGIADGGMLTNCYSAGAVSGTSYVGGLMGQNRSGTVAHCYSTGAVTGISYVGGLAGYNGSSGRMDRAGRVTDCYSTAAVMGTCIYAGGLVGENNGDVTHCYSAGAVDGNDCVGGLVGAGSALHSVWDIETSGLLTSAGGIGLTTHEMMDPNVLGLNGFANDPNWVLDPGRDYPRLAWEGRPGGIIPEPIIDWLEGQGTPDRPYRIELADQLIRLGGKAPTLWNKHFILGADIDLDPNLPGGKVFDNAVIPSFAGVLEGNGHSISHLTMKGVGSLGLFGQLESEAEVRDLAVVDVNIAGSGSYVGGLVGSNGSWWADARQGGTVTHCYSTGAVSGSRFVGGLVGSGSATNCYSTGEVTGTSYVGGLIGRGSATNCYSSGSVSGTSNVGGLVGVGTVTRCYSIGAVSGTSNVGGLVGWNESYATVLHSVWDVETSGLSGSAGGAGLTTAEMMDTYMLSLNGFANDPNWVLDAARDYPRLAWEGTAGAIIPEPNIDWLAGRGRPEDPYRIDTADQLILLGKASILWDGHFVLGADIDLHPGLPGRHLFAQALIPSFGGSFDGDGHTISHLTITGEGFRCLGLFGRLYGIVRDLGVVDVDITGSEYVTELVAYLETGSACVGGLVGHNTGTVTQCYSTGAIKGTGRYLGVGGLVGYNHYGTVTQCYSAGVVSGTVVGVGGLVGYNDYGTVTRCYSTGVVSSIEVGVGGLVGDNLYGHLSQCFWDTLTSGQITSAGGTGKNTAEMQTAKTFLDAGWDFVGETKNGTADIWWILEGKDYPRLWWELTEKKSAVTAGE